MGNLLQEQKRRNIYKVATFYVVASWVFLQVADTVFPLFGLSDSLLRLLMFALLTGFPLSLIMSWLYEYSAVGFRKTQVSLESTVPASNGTDLIAIFLLIIILGFTATPTSGVANSAQIHLLDIQTDTTKPLIQDGYNVRYAASGHIVYAYQRDIGATPFDIEKLEITGAATLIIPEVETYSFIGQSVYFFSDEGRLIYLPGIHIFQDQKRFFY